MLDVWEIASLSRTTRPVLGLTQPPIYWAPGAVSRVVQQPEREADHSSLASAKARNNRNLPPLPLVFSWCASGLYLFITKYFLLQV